MYLAKTRHVSKPWDQWSMSVSVVRDMDIIGIEYGVQMMAFIEWNSRSGIRYQMLDGGL